MQEQIYERKPCIIGTYETAGKQLGGQISDPADTAVLDTINLIAVEHLASGEHEIVEDNDTEHVVVWCNVGKTLAQKRLSEFHKASVELVRDVELKPVLARNGKPTISMRIRFIKHKKAELVPKRDDSVSDWQIAMVDGMCAQPLNHMDFPTLSASDQHVARLICADVHSIYRTMPYITTQISDVKLPNSGADSTEMGVSKSFYNLTFKGFSVLNSTALSKLFRNHGSFICSFVIESECKQSDVSPMLVKQTLNLIITVRRTTEPPLYQYIPIAFQDPTPSSGPFGPTPYEIVIQQHKGERPANSMRSSRTFASAPSSSYQRMEIVGKRKYPGTASSPAETDNESSVVRFCSKRTVGSARMNSSCINLD